MAVVPTPPAYEGGDLGCLVGELEARLASTTPGRRLAPDLAAVVPDASGYVLVLVDGLGDAALSHPAAGTLRAARRAVLDAPFPTTTSVALSTVATGLSPAGHGIVGHLMWVPSLGRVVNTLKWVTPFGARVDFDTRDLLPSPNLWERLAAAGVEAVTVQPADFEDSPLSRMLYRGCRFEPAWSMEDWVEAVCALAGPGRFVFAYLWQVDFAAHVAGSHSDAYAEAMALADETWSRLSERLDPGVGLLGTADHGHREYTADQKVTIRGPDVEGLVFAGDPRGVQIRGRIPGSLADRAGCDPIAVAEARPLWGPDSHPDLGARLPDALLLPPPDRILLPKGFDRRLIGYHGGLDPAERRIPLLVRTP